MARRIAITGATSGIGKQLALELAGAGHELVLLHRSPQKALATKAELEAAHAKPSATAVELVYCDLASFESVRAAASALLEAGRPLHGLVCNAGLYMPNERVETVDGHELHLQVHCLSHYLLQTLLLPLLEASAGVARVINISAMYHALSRIPVSAKFDADDGGKRRYDLEHPRNPPRCDEYSWTAFTANNDSKFALTCLSMRMARTTDNSKVAVFALHPGEYFTGIHAHLPCWERGIMHGLLWPGFSSISHSSKVILSLLLESQWECSSGLYFHGKSLEPTRADRRCYDVQLQDRLHAWATKRIGLDSRPPVNSKGEVKIASSA